jgi:hypothetical protein
MQTFTSFSELADHYHSEDVRRADNLRRSRAIARVRPGTGPRVAR